jgi:hypothetical protein
MVKGHSGEIFTARFDPEGTLIASGSMDRSISMEIQLARIIELIRACSAVENSWGV